MIKPEQISVVFQGPINEEIFKQTMGNNTQVLAGCELILSTENPLTDFSHCFHKIVDSPDPGPVEMATGFDVEPTGKYGYSWKGIKSNSGINRQLVSSLKGVEQATRPYVLKLRTDMIVNSLDWLIFYEEALANAKPAKLKQPILTGNYRDVSKWNMFPYHYHDWFNFGLKEDLIKLYSAPLLPKEFELDFNHLNQVGEMVTFDLRSTPETYIGGKLFCDQDVITFDTKQVLKDMINHYVPIDLSLQYAWSVKFQQEALFENCVMSFSSWKQRIKEENK